MVPLKGNVHSLAKPEFDLGRADSSRLIQGIALSFRPSPAQQQDLDNFLKELGDRSSPNYHKYLTPKQFGARFGLSQNDIDKVTAWLSSEGFSNIKVAHSHNRISFDGTLGQIESVLKVEMHSYLVDGLLHFANVGAPSVPAGLVGSVLYIEHLNDFAPRPHVKVKSHFTSYLSGNHFLSPGDFATVYDLQSLYSASIDGTGQKIAVIGQSSVNATDLSNFRSAAGLPASTVTMTLAGGTSTRCSGDEGESDLDLEWSGGVAKGAQIIFVYAGLNTGDTCSGSRVNSVWDALQYAVDNKVAPFISTSYGYCESGLGTTFADEVQGWAQQGQTQGQTITAASGDAGAADCDTSYPASQGLAVDVPASIPEVTGAGGNEFTGDAATCPQTGCTTNTAPADLPYWAASGAGSDAVSSALEYIPEMAWNDSVADSALAASGGGASANGYFTKPSWQTGTGVPNDGKRDVPDVSVTASADHDGYLVCSEDGPSNTIVATCTSGFRDTNGNLDVVGGTSAAAPTISAIFALINQYLGNVPPTGLAPINPTLYSLYPNNSTTQAFNDVTTGSNIVACAPSSPGCPSNHEYGFSAGTGYDQVTGLGSINGMSFAKAWDATRTATTTTITASASSANKGTSVTFTATVSPSTSGVVNFFNNGSSTSLGQANLSSGTAAFTTTSLPAGENSVTAGFAGNSTDSSSMSATPAVVSVTNTTASFTLTPSVTTLSVTQGQTTGPLQIVVSSTNGFVVGSGSSAQTLMPVTYTCAGLPSEANCLFSSSSASSSGSITTSATSVTLTISTTAPTAKLQRPPDRKQSVFYAMLLPGLLGVVVVFGSRRRALGTVRILTVIGLLSLGALWTTSCGGSSGGGTPSNSGTPTGSSNIFVNATTGGTNPITGIVKFTLTVQ
jgi:subtilase family serine protease